MDYLTLSVFDKIITREELVDVLGAVDQPNDPGSLILDDLEVNAKQEMTGYLHIRYDSEACLDDQNPIQILQTKMVDIMLWNAYSAISPNNIPELRQRRYEAAINWLEKVASGFITPALPVKDEDQDPRTTPLRYGNSKTKEDQYF